MRKASAMGFGRRLRELRESLDVTQAELADAAQMDQSLLSKYEREDVSPSWLQIERLLEAQQPDGIFMPGEGDAWYYLTSHALLAMHYCKADDGRIKRTHQAIERHLTQFQKIEFTDGLAESLIYLRWTGDPARGEASYIGYLRGRVAPNGGVCFRYSRDCEQHWHPVARVWQLFLEGGKR